MIKNKSIAKKISQLMIEYSAKLNSSLIDVQKKCTRDEFEKYRKAISYVLGEMLIRIMNPLYLENPELKPDELYVPGVDKRPKT